MIYRTIHRLQICAVGLLAFSLGAACSVGAQAPQTPPTVAATQQILPATVTPAAKATPGNPVLRLVWQTAYTAEAALFSPSDIVVDAQGNSYVTTQGDMGVKKFDPDGRLITQWGPAGSGDGQINLAAGISLDAHGDVYVADFYNTRIDKFDNVGTFLGKWNTEPPVGPASIAVFHNGSAFVDNFSPHSHYVQKFDLTGKLLGAWGSTGTGEGQFSAGATAGPEDIAVDGAGNVYVADRVNHRIQKFDGDGKLLAIFGGPANRKGHGQFDDPRGIAVDPQGNLYVLDSRFLQKLDPSGQPLAQWSTSGGDLDRAGIVAVDQAANIYLFANANVKSFASGTQVNVVVLKKFQQT